MAGKARHVLVRRGKVWPGRKGRVGPGETGLGPARPGVADMARLGMFWHVRLGIARWAWPGKVWFGRAWQAGHVAVRHGNDGLGWARRGRRGGAR
jgi:hypothetical protein